VAYSKQTWVNGVDKLNAARMGYIEDGIALASGHPFALTGAWYVNLGVRTGEYDGRVSVSTTPIGVPVLLPKGSYDAMSCKLETSGTAGALLRLGLVDFAGNVLKDFGTVAADTGNGMMTASSTAVAVDPGWYLLVVILQGVTTTSPQISGQQAFRGFTFGTNDLQYSPTSGITVAFTSYSGAMGSALTGRSIGSQYGTFVPLLQIRKSA
jgi:hypothetical protein